MMLIGGRLAPGVSHDYAAWAAEFAGIGHYLDEYGPRMPQALKDQQASIAASLAS